jgi:hypothetical protein
VSALCTHTDQIRMVELPETIAAAPTASPAAAAEPGEDWSWCVIDEVGFVVEARD